MKRLLRQFSLALTCWSAGAAFVLILAVLYGYVRYGSARAALVLCAGDSLLITPASIDLGEVNPGETRGVVVSFQNIGQDTLRVFGFRTTCTCLSAKGLPIDLPPGDESQATLDFRPAGNPEPHRETITFYVDGQCSPEAALAVAYEIRKLSAPKLRATEAETSGSNRVQSRLSSSSSKAAFRAYPRTDWARW